MITPLEFQVQSSFLGDCTWSGIARGRAWIADAVKVECFSTRNGKRIWTAPARIADRDTPYLDDPFTQIQNRVWMKSDGSVLLMLQHHESGFAVLALDGATGDKLWRRTFGGAPVSGRQVIRRAEIGPSGPAVSLWGKEHGVILVYTSELFPFESQRPTVLQERSALPSECTEIAQIDPRTGQYQWELVLPGQLPMITAPECRLVLHDGALCRIDTQGQFRPRFDLVELPESTLEVGGRLAIAYRDGDSALVGLSTGDTRQPRYLSVPHGKEVYDVGVQGDRHVIALVVNGSMTYVIDWDATIRWTMPGAATVVPLNAKQAVCKTASKLEVRDLVSGGVVLSGRVNRGRSNDVIWSSAAGRVACQFGSQVAVVTAQGPKVKPAPLASDLYIQTGVGRHALAWQQHRQTRRLLRPVLLTSKTDSE
jgi:outer membrane protein assembly factor BamB